MKTKRIAPLWQHMALSDRTGSLWFDSVHLPRDQRMMFVLWIAMPGHERPC